MLCAGMAILPSGRVSVTAGAATAADYYSGGFGFKNDGSLCIDTNAPAGSTFVDAIRQNATGAMYGTTVQSGTDVYLEGVRISALGQLVYESANPAYVTSGNPTTAAGNFAVT